MELTAKLTELKKNS